MCVEPIPNCKKGETIKTATGIFQCEDCELGFDAANGRCSERDTFDNCKEMAWAEDAADDQCLECEADHNLLPDGTCQEIIAHCVQQTGDICEECEEGYDVDKLGNCTDGDNCAEKDANDACYSCKAG